MGNSLGHGGAVGLLSAPRRRNHKTGESSAAGSCGCRRSDHTFSSLFASEKDRDANVLAVVYIVLNEHAKRLTDNTPSGRKLLPLIDCKKDGAEFRNTWHQLR
jgi:hypothetical protein